MSAHQRAETHQDRRQIVSSGAPGIAAASAAGRRVAQTSAATDAAAIRPFNYVASQEALNELRARVSATR